MGKFTRTFVLLCILNFAWEPTSGAVKTDSGHTCVIGAGYSGLAVARYLKQFGARYTVYEASRYVGGTWRFDPRVGTDEFGVPLFTSMYKGLRTNTPRQTMEYNGFEFPPGTPSFPSGECFYKYLQSFTKHFQLMDNIQLQSWVTSVGWAGEGWNLTYIRSDSRSSHSAHCDHVIIAVGQYIKPLVPSWPGMDTFKGKIIHSHDYKDPGEYRGRRVMVVGAGPSGLDLALHLANLTTRLVHSHHLVYNQPPYPDTFVKKPDIQEFTTSGVIFQDGTFEQLDDVILCTGYDFSYPFLDKSSGLTTSGKFVLPLHQHVVNIRHPSMMFVGNAHKIINRVLDVQAEYAAAVASGARALPSQDAMLKAWLAHVRGLKARGLKIVHVNVVGNDMDAYFANLTAEAGVTRAPPVLSDIRDFNGRNRLDDWANYRSYEFKILDDHHYDRRYQPIPYETCPIVLPDEGEAKHTQKTIDDQQILVPVTVD